MSNSDYFLDRVNANRAEMKEDRRAALLAAVTLLQGEVDLQMDGLHPDELDLITKLVAQFVPVLAV
jgi:hypothetical protein